MNENRSFLVIFCLMLLVQPRPAVAKLEIREACRAGYAPGANGTIKDVEEAVEILQRDKSPKKYSVAMDYIFSIRHASREALISDLDLLFAGIQLVQKEAWTYRKLTALDDSIVFVGKFGHSLIIDVKKRIYRGMAPEYLYEGGTWRPDFSRFRRLDDPDAY